MEERKLSKKIGASYLSTNSAQHGPVQHDKQTTSRWVVLLTNLYTASISVSPRARLGFIA